MWDPESLVIVTATFLLAGLVKGVIGLGLPTVAVAVLAATLGLTEAMVLMLIPSFVTNVWQGLVGGAFGAILKRIWLLLAAACVATWFAAGLLARSDAALLTALLGLLLCIYAAISLLTTQIPPPGRHEPWLSPLVGAASGATTGLTGTFVVPGVLYLQALGLPRDRLVQAMGIAFTVATLALAAALGGHGLLPPDLGALSLVAVAPALIGMWIGQKVRRRLPEKQFRRVFFGGLLLLGLYLVGRFSFG